MKLDKASGDNAPCFRVRSSKTRWERAVYHLGASDSRSLGAAGNATTTWNYDSQRDWLVSNLDHANKGPGYTYNTAGDLSAIDYSDATPDVSAITYDQQGRRTSVTDGGGTRTFTYGGGNQLATEANTTLGWAVTRTYDAQNRRASLAATLQPDTLTYTYSSTTGRLETLIQGDYEWTYGWNEPLATIATTTAKKNSNLILTATKTFDGHGRLTSIVNTDKNAVVFTSHTYTYDTLGRRTQAQREDTTYWDYTYDQYGQVTSGAKKRSDSTPIPGYQFGYTFDSIGNRTETNTNGRSESYTPNLLNQYTNKENQGVIDVTGTATTASIVAVNEQPTTRLDEYFAGTATGDNSTGATEITANIHAVNPGAGPNGEDVVSTATKSEIVPPEEEAFTYDDDGKWTYTWDAENRLITITPKSGNEALIGKKITFGYDTDAKRIWQDIADWNTGTASWDAPTRERYIYDGWNLLIIADDTLTTASKRFTWGYDLSNTVEEAGGIGGLLLSDVNSEGGIPMYDGNGNIIALGDGDSVLIGKYEYGPFGQVLICDDDRLSDHPFNWSTKFAISTEIFYYGYRYYNFKTGRWLSRDPLNEDGGENLLLFIGNDALNRGDFLGLKVCTKWRVDYRVWEGKSFNIWKLKSKLSLSFRGQFSVCNDCTKTLTGSFTGQLAGEVPLTPPWFLTASGIIQGNVNATWRNDQLEEIDLKVQLAGWFGGGIDGGIAKIVGEVGMTTSWTGDASSDDYNITLSAYGEDVNAKGRVRIKTGWGDWTYNRILLEVGGRIGKAPNFSFSVPLRKY